MKKRDPKGYYASLGVPYYATAEQIKQAYRKLAKLYHPDKNKSPFATASFQKINEAYEVLGKTDKRADYDAKAAAEEKPPPPREEAYAAPQAGREVRRPPELPPQPVACDVCGEVTAQPRYVTFWSVLSLIFVSYRKSISGVFCRSCADRQAIRSSLKTWLLGWWGFPNGPALALDALLRNLMGGDQPADRNAVLLGKQALAFAASGNIQLAHAAVEQALRLVRDSGIMAELLSLQSSLPPIAGEKHLKYRWGVATTAAFYIQLAPFLAIIFTLLFLFVHFTSKWLGPLGFDKGKIPYSQQYDAAKSSFSVGSVWYVNEENTPIYSEPYFSSKVVERLPRFASIRLLGERTNREFFPIIASSGTKGYVEISNFSPGSGEEAWLRWCGEKTYIEPLAPTLMTKAAGGTITLRLRNLLQDNVFLKFYDADKLVLAIYIGSGDSAEVPASPSGDFKLKYAKGKDFSPHCGIFMTEMEAYESSVPAVLQDGTMVLNLSDEYLSQLKPKPIIEKEFMK